MAGAGDIPSLSDDWSVRKVAAIVGGNEAAIHKLSKRGVFAGCVTVLDAVQAAWSDRSEAAAGRGGDDQAELTRQRAREAMASADLKQLEYFERVGELVALRDLEPQLIAHAVGARAEIENCVAKLIAGIESQHGIEVDPALVEGHVSSALETIASYETSLAADADEDEGAVPEAEEDIDA